MIPSPEIEKILFNGPIDKTQLAEFTDHLSFFDYSDFNAIHQLNTPGPIYTCNTDNCGTGQVEAMNNVGGTIDYQEIIFKQPFTWQELQETISAALMDTYGSYYFDGNKHWTEKLIINWWSKSEERVAYILELYYNELKLPAVLDRPLYGPREPIPENYKNWLDFYQNDMKEYLEWYIFKLSNKHTKLNDLNIDWTTKEEFDIILNKR